MPRRRQPPTLRASSLCALASLTLDSCKKRDGEQQDEIRQYVQDIPTVFANEYVNEVLRLDSRRRYDCDITSAFHPKCTEISAKGEGELGWSDKILPGLHVMSELINIEPVIDECESEEWKNFIFPNMSNLQSIKITLGINMQLLHQIIENSPRLEDIEIFKYSNQPDDVMRSTVLVLANGKNLKIIESDFLNSELAIHLLDNLPNLEVLNIELITEILPQCKRAYKLKDFGSADPKASEADSVQKIVTHFPCLENLIVAMDDNVRDMICELHSLKSLTLMSNASSNLNLLMDKCMFGLKELDLYDVPGLDSLFKQNMNVSYPNIESLTLISCTGVNVAGIIECFPNVKSPGLNSECVSHDLPCKMPHAGSQSLEELNIVNLPVEQVRYLLLFCSKLQSLDVCYTSAKSCVCEILCDANLKELHELIVRDDSMKREDIPIIFNSCGEFLEQVELHSRQLILSPDHTHELSNQLKLYDMHFCVNDSFSYDPDNDDLNDR